MYAERFNAPEWLEEPAQWLWWAMQSRINGELENAHYNLQKFWTVLAQFKASANETTWPEILALDSQSHIQAANLTSAIILQMEKDANTAAAWIRFFSGTIYNRWKETNGVRAAISRMQEQRKTELETAANLAGQARTATAERAQYLAEQRISTEESERMMENRNIENIMKNDSEDGSIPLWAWAIGALAIVILVRR